MTTEEIPPMMRAVVAPKRGPPSNYDIRDIPAPTITDQEYVIVKVHSASINPGEVMALTGGARIIYEPE